ncbi:MAG: OmpA family protein [Ketobacteraceae bacterium]|nr:OmpA family protein [Ketobacteraceae bacterium]
MTTTSPDGKHYTRDATKPAFDDGTQEAAGQSEPTRVTAPGSTDPDLKTTAENPAMKIGKQGMIFTLERLVFESNSYVLDTNALKTLERVAEFLNQHPDMQVIVEGHADNHGSELYNTELSRKRALTVYQHLIKLGVSEAVLTVVAHGEKYPVSNLPEDARKNRRVEIVISESKAPES